MPRKKSSKTTASSQSDDTSEETNPTDEFWDRLDSIERDVNRRFEAIEEELQTIRNRSETPLKRDDDERFLKLCHAVDYLLEHSTFDYDTLACREMVLSLLGQKMSRPFSGRTIRNRQLIKRVKRWCCFVAVILALVVCLSLYGLSRHWCYVLVMICLLGSLLSSIGVRKIYKIIDVIW